MSKRWAFEPLEAFVGVVFHMFRCITEIVNQNKNVARIKQKKSNRGVRFGDFKSEIP